MKLLWPKTEKIRINLDLKGDKNTRLIQQFQVSNIASVSTQLQMMIPEGPSSGITQQTMKDVRTAIHNMLVLEKINFKMTKTLMSSD